jgi:hypothetical protein
MVRTYYLSLMIMGFFLMTNFTYHNISNEYISGCTKSLYLFIIERSGVIFHVWLENLNLY